MKIRNGFVSNSSSSSFVVIFPTEPKNSEDVKNMLFNKNEKSYSEYSVDQVAKTVWTDICNQTKNNIELAKEEFEGCSDSPDYDDFKGYSNWIERSAAYNASVKIFAEKKMKDFFNIRKLKLQKINNEDISESGVLYIFEYSDNDSEYFSALEHDGLFDNLKHIRISKH